jgi:hypothetical protein
VNTTAVAAIATKYCDAFEVDEDISPLNSKAGRHTDEAPGLSAFFFELRIPQPVDGFLSR